MFKTSNKNNKQITNLRAEEINQFLDIKGFIRRFCEETQKKYTE